MSSVLVHLNILGQIYRATDVIKGFTLEVKNLITRDPKEHFWKDISKNITTENKAALIKQVSIEMKQAKQIGELQKRVRVLEKDRENLQKKLAQTKQFLSRFVLPIDLDDLT